MIIRSNQARTSQHPAELSSESEVVAAGKQAVGS